MGFTKAIIGSSGGIDSAVTIALACEALGKGKCESDYNAFGIFVIAFHR